jgi:hypothetical protein
MEGQFREFGGRQGIVVERRREPEGRQGLDHPIVLFQEVGESHHGCSDGAGAALTGQGAEDALKVSHVGAILREVAHVAADSLQLPVERLVIGGRIRLPPAIHQPGHHVRAQGETRRGLMPAFALDAPAVEEFHVPEAIRVFGPKEALGGEVGTGGDRTVRHG